MPDKETPAAPRPQSVRLSVIVPVYNERYLVRDLLTRVLTVEHPSIAELEVVVVDDGSTDGTREILRELAGRACAISSTRATRVKGPPSAPASPPPPAI